MSNLLKEAIVDAEALRQAALKNAEASVIEKYSSEVRDTLSQLLEQDLGDLDLGLGATPTADTPAPADVADPAATGEDDESLEEDVGDVPYSATDDLSKMKGQNLKSIPGEGQGVEVTLDLGALRESVEALQAEIDEELSFDEEELAEMLSDDEEEIVEVESPAVSSAAEEEADTAAMDSLEGTPPQPEEEEGAIGAAEMATESIEISEELIDSIMEKLTVDMGASLSGWAGRSSESMKWELEKALAQRRTTDVQDELDVMKKAQEELVFENKQLKGRLSQYEQVTGELKETLQTVNLSNARLLYTNRVLRNTSLNERQKIRIAEAISKADSVTEAKTIFNTLQSTVESTPKRGPQSLSEAISRPSSVIRASRKETAQPTDVFAKRMRRLAGIK